LGCSRTWCSCSRMDRAAASAPQNLSPRVGAP
jgi:hypothetical protein